MTIKVIGAGLARTGTKSLKIALEQLGYDPCFHMVELLKNPKRLNYLDLSHKAGATDWAAFLEGYQAAVDYPTCFYYKQLLAHRLCRPTAKVILTVRDPESWYQSVLKTVYRGKPKGFRDIIRLIRHMIFSADMRRVAPVFQYNDKLIWQGHFNGKFEDKEAAIQVYHDHVEDVKKHVPADQLLIFEIQQGWQPLCDFLGKSIPKQPFPKSNSMVEFNQKMDSLLIDGVFVP